KEWKNKSVIIETTPTPDWTISERHFPIPGLAIASGGHMGIVDYDGFWIHANSYYVCKTIELGFVGRPTEILRERE
ncbi:MAG: hypothetical protein IJY80_01175, partial [Opitutales bacterium]|nr:hypothetical protein [Opitutales bacterium]